jgi:hypothetical protein
MTFHLPSFFLGVIVGAGGAAIAPRIRPVALEFATVCYRAFDAAMVQIARGRENASDLLAEARARATDTLRRTGIQNRPGNGHAVEARA